MMGIFSNGFRTSKSKSLLIIASAFPESASSRNILSFGSRQTLTSWLILINLLFSVKRCTKISRSYSLLKYLSNFFFLTVASNSAVTAQDRIISCSLKPFRTTRSLIDPFRIAALIKTLVSRTIIIYDSSFNKSFRISSVIPCCLAYSLMLSITWNKVRLSFSKRDNVSSVNDFSASDNCSNLLASSSSTFSVIVFINQR